MKIIVDANIVFSAILNTNSKIGDLLINSQGKFEFIAPEFLRIEIRRLHQRLSKISKLTLDEVMESEFHVCQNIHFISEEQIRTSAWLAAEKLVADVDPKDIHYVAYAKHFKCKLWSGDKELLNGLLKKKFRQVITTEELYKRR